MRRLGPLEIVVINAILIGMLAVFTSIADGIPTVEELYLAVILGVTTFIGQLLVYFKGMKPPPSTPGNSERNDQAREPKIGMLLWP